MNVISFALWGDGPKYIDGLNANIELAAVHYPGWSVVVAFPFRTITQAVVDYASSTWAMWDGYDAPDLWGLFARFHPAANPNYEHVLIRDADSRINAREAAAVSEWIQSGKAFHVMRDHPRHRRPMLGGMWGCRGGALPDIDDQINDWLAGRRVKHDMDQRFLADVVWPKARRDCFVHDSQDWRQGGETQAWENVKALWYIAADPSPGAGEVLYKRPHKFPPHADISPSRFVGDVILADGTADQSIQDPHVLTTTTQGGTP